MKRWECVGERTMGRVEEIKGRKTRLMLVEEKGTKGEKKKNTEEKFGGGRR